MCTSLREWVPGPGRCAAWLTRPGLTRLGFTRLGLTCLGLLGLGCGDDPEAAWTGSQTCAVGVPPDQADAPIEPAQYPLSTEVLRTADTLILRNFTLGPIGGFSCIAYDEVTASLGATMVLDATLTQPVTLAPFDCFGSDGRMYRLGGSGTASFTQLFFTQTFDAWFEDGEGILICTSTFREVREQVAPLDGMQEPGDMTPAP